MEIEGKTGGLVERLRKEGQKYQWALVWEEAGAGHGRQMWDVYKLLDSAGIEPVIVKLDAGKSGNVLVRMIKENYARLQNNPILEKILKNIAAWTIFDGISEQAARALGQPEELERALLAAGISRDKSLNLISTYPSGAQSAVLLGREKWPNLRIGEWVPDPWKLKLDVRAMVARDGLGEKRHLCVVYDEETLAADKLYRGGRKFMAMGTLSAPEMAFLQVQAKKDFNKIPVHLGIEFSGNDIDNFNRKILKFLETVREKIKDGEINLTVDVMQHAKTRKKLENFLTKNGLADSEHIQLIGGDDMYRAIQNRHEYAVGRCKFGLADVVITKGGEVPLEDRGQCLIVVVYGIGHEMEDTRVAIRDKPGFVVDMSQMPEIRWWAAIMRCLAQMPEGMPPIRSRALLALGEMLDYLKM